MNNSGADLGFYVIADDGQPGFYKAVMPVRFPADEDGDAINEPDPGIQYLLYVPLGSLFAANRQVINGHIGFDFFKYVHDISGWSGRLLNDFT